MLQVTIQNTLSSLGVLGGMVRSLHAFIDDVVCVDNINRHKPKYGQTHQAFAAALSTYLQEFTQDIAAIEKAVKAQGK